ncbi:MAG: FkbM family methyltransferase [Oscillospiraceae bacterium]|nr:FkbM family methyltransferase [Oscillospiraceae bacterium]
MAFFLDEIDSCLWDYLAQTDKKIVLYGMGDGAEKIQNVLLSIGVQIDDIMASDEFVRGHSFLGIRVKKLSEIEELYGDNFIILVSFGSQFPEVMEHIYAIAEKHELYAPNVPVVGEGLFTLDYAKEHYNEIKSAYELMADEQSKKVFENVIRYKLSGNISLLRECESPREEMFDLLRINSEEIYVDLGAYNGDTLVEFLNETSMKFRKLYAMEPDHKNYMKLKRRLYMIGSALLEAYNCGAWDCETTLQFSLRAGRSSKVSASATARTKEVKMMSVDHMLQGGEATFIKYDVEGSEDKALEGTRQTITKYRPKLNVAVYHRNEDMFAIPLKIAAMNRKYKIYLRHHPYVPDWDTNIYCI